jgi:hypothetical protein
MDYTLHNPRLRVCPTTNHLKLPKAPRKRISTSQLGGEFAKRPETLEDQDSGGDDISNVSQMKWELKLEQNRKEKERLSKYILKQSRRRLRLYCCSCEEGTGVNISGVLYTCPLRHIMKVSAVILPTRAGDRSSCLFFFRISRILHLQPSLASNFRRIGRDKT